MKIIFTPPLKIKLNLTVIICLSLCLMGTTVFSTGAKKDSQIQPQNFPSSNVGFKEMRSSAVKFFNSGKTNECFHILDSLISDLENQSLDSVMTAELCSTYVYRSYYYKEDGKFLQAKQDRAKAWKLSVDIKWENQYTARVISHPLGNYYSRLGDYENAIFHLKKAKNLYSKYGMTDKLATINNDMGIAYESMGDLFNADRFFRESLGFCRKDSYEELLAKTNLARFLLEYNEVEEAKTYSLEVMSAIKRNHLVEPEFLELKADCLHNLAHYYLKQGNEKAFDYFDDAISLLTELNGNRHDRELSQVFIDRGNGNLKMENAKSALVDFQYGLSCVSPSLNSSSIFFLPSPEQIYPENRILQALKGKADCGLLLYNETGNLIFLKYAYKCHQLSSICENKLWDTYQFNTSKLIFSSFIHTRTEKAMEICYLLYQETGNKQYMATAFQLSYRSKAQVYRENRKRMEINFLEWVPDSVRDKDKFLRGQIVALESELNAEVEGEVKDSLEMDLSVAQLQYSELEREMEEKYPVLNKLRLDGKGGNFAALKANLPQNSISIEYFLGDSTIFITSFADSPGFYAFPRTSEFDFALNYLSDSLAGLSSLSKEWYNPDVYCRFTNSAYYLYHSLISPVLQNSTPSHDALVIIPDGDLGKLPFDILVNSPQTSFQVNYKNLPFVLKDYSISYKNLRSDQENVFQQNQHWRNKGVLALAPFTEEGLTCKHPFEEREESFHQLRRTRNEVESLVRIKGGKAVVGQKATIELLIKEHKNWPIIHLATHGEFSDPPDKSFLILSAASRDTFLFANKLFGTELNLQHLVLSTCDLGAGNNINGEGIMSFQRYAQERGCQSTLSNLWPARGDAFDSEHDLIVNYYQFLAQGYPKEKALQNAKLKFIEESKYHHPMYWAGWVLYGDTAPIKW